MARWRLGRSSGGEESLDFIIEMIRQSVGDPASMVLWCGKALRHRHVRTNPRELALARVLYARGLGDLEDGNRPQNLERALKALKEAIADYERLGEDDGLFSAVHDLGILYGKRIEGDKGQNIEQSIACHNRGLALATTPADRAMAAYELAWGYRTRLEGDPTDNTESAIANLKTAVEGYRASGENRRWADANSLLGACYEQRRKGSRRDNMEEAIGCYKAAADAYDEGSDKWADAIHSLGTAYSNRIAGDEVENREFALRLFQKMLHATDPDASPMRWSNVNHALGMIYTIRNRGDRAENIELAIKHLAESLGYLDPRRDLENWQITHQTLAAAYDYRLAGNRGANLDRAVEHLITALEEGGRSDHPQSWAMLQQSLALVYLKRAQEGSPAGDRGEDLTQAREALENVLTIRTREADPAGWARAMQVMTELQDEENARRPDSGPAAGRGSGGNEARMQELERSIATLRSTADVYDRDADPEGWARNRLLLEEELGKYALLTAPDRHWEERADLLRDSLEVHTPDSNPRLRARTATRLGNALAALDRWKDAADAFCLAVEAAESEYPAALTVLGRRYQRESGPSAARLASYCLAKAGRLMDAVIMLERGQARALGDTLERDHGRLDDLARDDPRLHRLYRDAADRLRRLQDAEHPSGDAGEILTELAHRMRAARETLDSVVRRIRRTKGYEDFLEPPGLSLLDEVVRPEVPVAYLSTTPWGSLTLLVSRQESIKVTPLWARFTDTDMNDLLHRSVSKDTTFPIMAGYLRLLYNIVETRFADGNAALTHGPHFDDLGVVHRTGREELGRLDVLGHSIIQPLAETLHSPRPSRVILIPCGTLALMPLHTIAYDDGRRCLFDDLAVSFAPSARILRHARERAALARSERPVLAGVGNPQPHPQPLWFATRELGEISALFDDATCLYGEDATKDRLLDAAQSATHVHLACHGAVPFGSREVPYLEMAGGERLTVDEIARRRPFPAARLVVLSACQSALVGSFRQADEEMGLPTAVMLSGTPGVIGTLWAVNDLPTSLLMEHFYDLLLRSGSTSLEPWDALGSAQRWLSELTVVELRSLLDADPALRHLAEENRSRSPGSRSVLATLSELEDPGSRPFADPFYWAPFVYVGE